MPWLSTIRTPHASEEAAIYEHLINRLAKLTKGPVLFNEEFNDLACEIEVLARTTCISKVEFQLKALLWEMNELHVDSPDWTRLHSLAIIARIDGHDEYLPDRLERTVSAA